MRRLPLLAALLLPLACAPQEGGRQAAPDARPPLEAAAARLPESAAGFERGSAVWHEPERPGLGVTVDYAGPARAAVATVSLYDRGEPPLSGADAAPRVARELNEAVADVVAQAGTRTNQSLSERERVQVAVPGGAPLSCARLEGTYGRQQMRTLVCLGAAAGRFMKVQVTSSARPVRPVEELPFVVEIAQAARAG